MTTAAGELKLRRVYVECPACLDSGYPLDERLGVAGGAKWIWEEQRKHLHGADGVLDIFHALERVADVSKVLHKSEEDATAWTDQARTTLLELGWSGIEALLPSGAENRTEFQQQAVEDLRNYLFPHEHH